MKPAGGPVWPMTRNLSARQRLLGSIRPRMFRTDGRGWLLDLGGAVPGQGRVVLLWERGLCGGKTKGTLRASWPAGRWRAHVGM